MRCKESYDARQHQQGNIMQEEGEVPREIGKSGQRWELTGEEGKR
jgi:hypothetical protein